MTEINNSQDIMDSRDVIARIEELEEMFPKSRHTVMPGTADEIAEIKEELVVLKSLADEAEASPDWPHGETLIRDSYFKEYAEELANDIGAVDSEANWPACHIDWDAAAESLKQDYMSVDYDGTEYWIRA